MKSTDMLMRDHDLIQMALTVLASLASRAERGEPIAREPIDQLVLFFTDFADRFHHAKEEGELFPFMEAQGMPHRAGPIAVMLHEHEQGRALLRGVAEATGGLSGAEGRARFAEAARAYEELLGAHIMKENNILFPMAARMMTPADDDALVQRFADREQVTLGEGGAGRMGRMIEGLALEYVG